MEREARWYVVHTYSGYENKVKQNLEKVVDNRDMREEILDCTVPTETVEEIASDGSGKRRTVERKLFPGYVYVKIAVQFEDDGLPKISDQSWWVVRNIRGVTGFVGPDNKPAPLSETEVQSMGVEKSRIESKLEIGDFVNITSPNFEGCTGYVTAVDLEEGTAKVSIAMFGQETLVDLDLEHIEKIV
jgi:transcriptional antiterminator NusG